MLSVHTFCRGAQTSDLPYSVLDGILGHEAFIKWVGAGRLQNKSRSSRLPKPLGSKPRSLLLELAH